MAQLPVSLLELCVEVEEWDGVGVGPLPTATGAEFIAGLTIPPPPPPPPGPPPENQKQRAALLF